MGWLFLACAFVLNSAGGFLLKLASVREPGFSLEGGVGKVLLQFTHHPILIAGIFCFAINVLFYFAALRMLPLSVASPIMVSMTLIIVATLSVVFLGEALTAIQIAGYGAIVLGVVMVSAFAL